MLCKQGTGEHLDQGTAEIGDLTAHLPLNENHSSLEAFNDEDRFLQQTIKIKGESCSVGNSAVNLVRALFTPEELAGRNCSGKKGKMPLDNVKLQKVKGYVLKLYPSQASQRETQWKTCVIAIDEYLRHRKKSDCAVEREV